MVLREHAALFSSFPNPNRLEPTSTAHVVNLSHIVHGCEIPSILADSDSLAYIIGNVLGNKEVELMKVMCIVGRAMLV